MKRLVEATDNYSASDLTHLCKDAAMGPVRDLSSDLASTPVDKIGPVVWAHFEQALKTIKPSVSAEKLKEYLRFQA